MDTASLLQGAIIGFREGLEAFLIIAIMLEYLNKTKQPLFKRNVKQGLVIGLLVSVLFGVALFFIAAAIGQNTDTLAKAWESVVSLLAMLLITTFIVWMIKHGRHMVSNIEQSTQSNLSRKGLIILATVMVAREGAEVVLFMVASTDKTSYVLGIAIGLIISAALAFLIYKSLIKVNLKIIFNITLAYLILQAGFLLGYAVHEGLSFLKSTGVMLESNAAFTKLYDLKDTLLDHKTGPIGLPLYVLFGWYSRPEWIQFALQYLYTFSLFAVWLRYARKK
ncbi:MAG: hydrogenase [Clostridia bacterium]|jgi:high-affinity iron transporter|nr:hydrogenase [Clostridia bacterium]MBT7122235.1 hydrogenase [Clostridia bacterium]